MDEKISPSSPWMKIYIILLSMDENFIIIPCLDDLCKGKKEEEEERLCMHCHERR
jgi:hypothetical protein